MRCWPRRKNNNNKHTAAGVAALSQQQETKKPKKSEEMGAFPEKPSWLENTNRAGILGDSAASSRSLER
jgi:hypothetical protein